MEDHIIIGIFAVLASFILLFLLVGIVLYVLYALGMYRIAQTLGRKDLAFLAWIPLAQTFLLPIVVENDVHEQIRGKFTLIYALSWLGAIIFGVFFQPFTFVPMLVLLYGFYILAMRFSTQALAHTVIAIVTLGLSVPVSLFMFRNRQVLEP